MAMTSAPETLSERDEIEMLLPWYVTGRIDAADKARVEAFLVREPAMRRQLDLIREEQDGNIAVNEAIRAPRGVSVERGMAAVAAGTTLGARQTALGFVDRVRGFFTMPTAAAVRYATVAAAAVFMLQALAIGTLWTRGGDGYVTASGGGAADGATAIVKFVDGASAASVAEALSKLGMTIVDGPKPGGTFVVRVGAKSLTPAERAARISDLRKASGVVGLVMP
jgi:anti-sigma factor RsiW